MSLVQCAECGNEVSSAAATCPQCGAPVRRKFKWWLWVPLGLIAAFLLFGALIPENVSRANAFHRTCMEMLAKGLATNLQCDQIEADIRNGSR